MEQSRTVSPQALVSFAGNFYSVPPGLAGAQVTVRTRLGEHILHVITAGRAIVAQHHRAPDGAGSRRYQQLRGEATCPTSNSTTPPRLCPASWTRPEPSG
ncbi:hypothetical protein [Streptomyces sp. NPDC001851]|uniref:Mu transposase domain-containing protein n=1 Tax=Streptomyces sp. NPDC001851 TaxID=3154529 RepID=UPI00331A3630